MQQLEIEREQMRQQYMQQLEIERQQYMQQLEIEREQYMQQLEIEREQMRQQYAAVLEKKKLYKKHLNGAMAEVANMHEQIRIKNSQIEELEFENSDIGLKMSEMELRLTRIVAEHEELHSYTSSLEYRIAEHEQICNQ